CGLKLRHFPSQAQTSPSACKSISSCLLMPFQCFQYVRYVTGNREPIRIMARFFSELILGLADVSPQTEKRRRILSGPSLQSFPLPLRPTRSGSFLLGDSFAGKGSQRTLRFRT